MPRIIQPNNLCDEITIEAICELLKLGVPLEDCCFHCETTISALSRAIQDDPEVASKLRQADSTLIVEAHKVLNGAMKGNSASLSDKDVATAKWLLAKKRRKEYGDTQSIVTEAQTAALISASNAEITLEQRAARVRGVLGVAENVEPPVIEAEYSTPEEMPRTAVKRRTAPRRARAVEEAAKTLSEVLPYGSGFSAPVKHI